MECLLQLHIKKMTAAKTAVFWGQNHENWLFTTGLPAGGQGY